MIAAAVVVVAVPVTAVLAVGAGGSTRGPGYERLTLTSRADAFTDAQRPTTNFGGLPYADALWQTSTAFLRFVVPAARLPELPLTGASLELYATHLATARGGAEITTAPDRWSERTLTAADMPAVGTTLLGPVVRPTAGRYTNIRLTDLAAIVPSRPVSLAVRYSVAMSQFQFATRESREPPRLVLVFGTRPVRRAPGARVLATTRPRPATADPNLPFDWPSRVRARDARHLVFACYFTPFPRSLDNLPPSQDYYSRVLLRPVGATAAYGGLLRDRPLGRDPLPGDWQRTDMAFDVRAAIAAGIDGWTLDLLSPGGPNWARDLLMIRTAHAVDPAFKVMLMPDMTASFGRLGVDAMASRLARLARLPGVFRLADGRLVLSPFAAERWQPATWRALFHRLRARYGIRTAFVPMFLDYHPHAAAYASISFGFSDWGTRSPSVADGIAADAQAVHRRGKLWMQTLAVQDARPDQGSWFEADNLAELRDGWQQAIRGNADWVQLATWNDYSEATAIAPSTAHGYTFLDVSAYYAARYETGYTPKIVRDTLYLTNRDQFTGAEPREHETSLMRLRSPSSPPRNDVEVQSFLVAPATVTIHVGSRTVVWDAPAGVSVRDVPLGYGRVDAEATRGGQVVARVAATRAVVAHPAVQDLQYWAASSRP